MPLNIDPTRVKGPFQLLAVFLIVTEAGLGVWITAVAKEPNERIVAGVIMAIILILFLFRLPKDSKLSTNTHLPKVILDFPISPSVIKLDSEKCKYKINKTNGKVIKGKANPAFGKGGWQITIPQDVSSDDDTIELTLVEKSGKVWTTIPFFPHITTQKAIGEDEEQ